MKRILCTITWVLMLALVNPVWAYEAGDWVLRAGLTMVDPDTSSDTIDLPTGLTAEADVDDNIQLGIIPAYMLTANLGVELLAATPFEHDIEAQGTGALAGTNIDAGETKHLPPTVMLQWYPRGSSEGWQPYVGVGINYTVFFNEEVDEDLIATLGDLTMGAVDDANLDLDDSFGFAAQVGVDVPIGDKLSLNAGIWYLDIGTEATITALAGGAEAAEVKFDVDIDPWVYNLGIAYRF